MTETTILPSTSWEPRQDQDPLGLVSEPRTKQVALWQQGKNVEQVFDEQMDDLQAARRALVAQMSASEYKIGPDSVEALLTLMREERALIGAAGVVAEAGKSSSNSSGNLGGVQVNIVPGAGNSGPIAGARVIPDMAPLNGSQMR